jgi:hypothetical protein
LTLGQEKGIGVQKVGGTGVPYGSGSLLIPVDPEVEGERELASRPQTLDGLVLGLLDNRKTNADHLLLKIGEALGERYSLQDIVYVTKPIFSRPAPNDQLEQLKACHLVVTALAD